MINKDKGGANTKTGLVFEGHTDLATFLNTQKDYRVNNGMVYFRDEQVARIFKKHQLYKFLEEYKIDWRDILSQKLLPDDSIYVVIKNTLYIIECKFQKVAGSVRSEPASPYREKETYLSPSTHGFWFMNKEKKFSAAGY